MSLKQTIGKKLIDIGIAWAGLPIEEEPRKHIDRINQVPHSAVVEAEEVRQDWEPVQHGNVIIAEPAVMREFRRHKHDM
jgi:hypothetical protein